MMAYHTGDGFMDQWLNRLMRCDKSKLNCGASLLHLLLQAFGPWSRSRVDIFDIDQSFSIPAWFPDVGPVATTKKIGSVEYN